MTDRMNLGQKKINIFSSISYHNFILSTHEKATRFSAIIVGTLCLLCLCAHFIGGCQTMFCEA